MALFFKHQLFLAGIKDPIRDKVLEAGKAMFQESMKLSREIEAIQNDRKRSQKIAAVKASMQPNEADAIFWDELANKEINQIAAVHCQQPFLQLQPGPNKRPCSGMQQQSVQSQHRVLLLQKERPHAKGVQLSSS